MKKTLSLLLLFVLASPPLVLGQLSPNTPQGTKLAGVNEMQVVVAPSNFDKDKRLDGFNSEAYKTAVELRLRQLGIPLVDSFNTQFSQRGILKVEVSSIKILDSVYAVMIKVLLSRLVGYYDGGEWDTGIADVWDTGTVFLVGMENVGDIKEVVVELADEFANDYLMANPPEPRSYQGAD